MIQIKELYLSFNGKPVLENINLEVKKGDFLAIIGPNGGGKSTLIKCILGFLKPERGEIFLWNKPLKEFRDWHLIGYVPQRAGKNLHNLYPLTLEDFLLLASKIYKRPIKREYLEVLLETFGLKDLLGKKIFHLSFGQLQRAYLVRALLLEPELLILDEPSVGLDFFSQKTFYEVLSQFHKKGLTIILVTHETWLLTKEVNKVACMNQRLYFHGSHPEFCVFAEKGISYFDFHRIEHTHW